jgi:hypothetical protein
MEVTKWLKPSTRVSRIGDSASVQAATRVNAEQVSKRTMCRRAGASVLRPRDLGRHKRGVSDRDGRSLWASQSFNLGTELLHERRDNACTESGFWLKKVAVRPANPIVRDRKLPIRSGHIKRDGDLTFDFILGERILQCIDDEFGND